MLLFCLQFSSLLFQLFCLILQSDYSSLIFCYFAKQVSIGTLFAQKFLDQCLCVIDSGRGFDVLEGDLYNIKLEHFSIHFIPEEFLDETMTKIYFIPIFLFFALILKSIQRNFLHLLTSDLTASHKIFLLDKHTFNTVNMRISLSLLSFEMSKQFTFKFFRFIIFLFLLLVFLQNHSSQSPYMFKIFLHVKFSQVIDYFVMFQPIDHTKHDLFVDFSLFEKIFHLLQICLK